MARNYTFTVPFSITPGSAREIKVWKALARVLNDDEMSEVLWQMSRPELLQLPIEVLQLTEAQALWLSRLGVSTLDSLTKLTSAALTGRGEMRRLTVMSIRRKLRRFELDLQA